MILIIDMNAKKDGLGHLEFVRPVERIILASGFKAFSRHYTRVSAADLKKAGKVILSGTPLIDNAFLADADRFAWLATFDKPVLGICAGMQAIASALGGEVIEAREIGMIKVRTVKKNPLFSGEFEAYALHGNAVKPGADFEVLAESERCVQAFRHRKRSIYGILFHPEVRNEKIIEKFCGLK